LTILYCSTDRLCRGGAPMEYLAHSASLHSNEKTAPSKPGIKHLDRFRSTWNRSAENSVARAPIKAVRAIDHNALSLRDTAAIDARAPKGFDAAAPLT
jgi:hypothetical protein